MSQCFLCRADPVVDGLVICRGCLDKHRTIHREAAAFRKMVAEGWYVLPPDENGEALCYSLEHDYLRGRGPTPLEAVEAADAAGRKA